MRCPKGSMLSLKCFQIFFGGFVGFLDPGCALWLPSGCTWSFHCEQWPVDPGYYPKQFLLRIPSMSNQDFWGLSWFSRVYNFYCRCSEKVWKNSCQGAFRMNTNPWSSPRAFQKNFQRQPFVCNIQRSPMKPRFGGLWNGTRDLGRGSNNATLKMYTPED